MHKQRRESIINVGRVSQLWGIAQEPLIGLLPSSSLSFSFSLI